MKLKTKIWLLVSVILLAVVYKGCNVVYDGTKSVYNTHITLEQEYMQAEEDLVATYQANYLSFQQQFDIATINEKAFITVTDIIMSNRRDGESVAWKWMHENQQIPYEEFSSFYKNLTSFTQSQYNEYLSIERKKQSIVNRHNSFIKVYPNNVYNWWLKIKPINYRQGYVTEQTKSLFHYKE